MVEPWTAHKRALKAHMWAEAQRVKVTVPFLNKHTEDCRYTHLSTCTEKEKNKSCCTYTVYEDLPESTQETVHDL